FVLIRSSPARRLVMNRNKAACAFAGRRLVQTLLLLLATSASSRVGAQHSEVAPSSVRVVTLRAEYRENPLGVDVPQPRLSWQIEGESRGIVQTAYQLRVATSAEHLRADRALLWDSGRVASDESVHRPYLGPALTSGRRYWWQVRIWDQAGAVSPWSDAAWW